MKKHLNISLEKNKEETLKIMANILTQPNEQDIQQISYKIDKSMFNTYLKGKTD